MKVSMGFVACAVMAMVGLSAQAQLPVEEMLGKLAGRWAHESKGVICGDDAVAIHLSADLKSATITNWVAGATKTFDVRRVVSIQQRGQADKGGVLSLIDMTAAPPVFLSLIMPSADTISIASQTRPSDPSTEFTRCPSAG